VLLDYTLTDVRAITDDLIRHIAVQTVRDASATDCVRAYARRTLVGGIPLDCRTLPEAAVVRALGTVDTGPSPAVDIGPQRRLVRSPLAGG
jgi:hypothetical protein